MRLSQYELNKLIDRGTCSIAGVTDVERQAILDEWQPPPGASDELKAAIDRANAKAKPPLEDQEQAALIVWLKQRGIRHHHSPNGGFRHKKTAGEMKSQGVSAGFPDLMIFPPDESRGIPILFIELKRTKGGQVSESQQDWLNYLEGLEPNHCIRSRVCRGFEEARNFILAYGY